MKSFKLLLFFILLIPALSFADIKGVKQFPETEVLKEKDPHDNELLRLIFQVFLQTNDIENAYKVAKKAISIYPEDLYWRGKLAEVSIWLGKSDEALENYYYIMKRGRDGDVMNKVLNLALARHSYDIAIEVLKKKIERGDLTKTKDLIFSYESLGYPERAVKVLEELYSKKPSAALLKDIARLKLAYGDIEGCLQGLKTLRKRYGLDVEAAIMMANTLYAKGAFRDAFEVLRSVKDKAKMEDEDYWKTLSDLSWAMKDFSTALESSYNLYNLQKARSEDIERIVLIESERDSELSTKMALEGWNKYKLPSFFYIYVSLAMRDKKWRDLASVLEGMEKEDIELLKGMPLFWTIKAWVFRTTGKYQEARKAYLMAINLDPESPDIKSSFIWFLMEIEDAGLLEKYMHIWEKKEKIKENLYVPFAASYFFLQRPEKAIRYMKEVIKNKGEDPHLLSFYADIIQTTENIDWAQKIRLKAWRILHKKGLDLKDAEGLRTALRLSLHIEGTDKIKELFKNAEGLLSEKELREIKISWYLMRDEHDYVRYLINKYRNARAWMLLNLALAQDDRDDQLALLYRYFKILPMRDRVEAARRTGNIKLAEELAFKGLEDNYSDYLLYKQMRDLYVEYVDRIDSNFQVVKRQALNRGEWNFDMRKHLYKDIYLEPYVSLGNNTSTDENVLINPPHWDKLIGARLRFKRDEGYFLSGIGWREALKSLPMFEFGYSSHMKNLVNLGIFFNYNSSAYENIYLLLGGVKDEIKVVANHRITPKTSLYSSASYQRFYSQDREYLGDGEYLYLEGQRKLRVGYPDYTLRGYFSGGMYNERGGDKGVIESLSPFEVIDVLPESFWEFGTGFLFGMDHRDNYTRIWRPFFDTHVSFNSVTGLGYGISGGIGGSFFGRDNLSIGLNYTHRVKGLEDYIFNLQIKYLHLF